MNVKRIIRRVTDNDYLFTIFTKILAVLIGLVASFYSNRFLGPQLKGELGRISSLLSIVAVTANFGLYQPYPYYKRQGEPDVLNQFLRIFLLQFIVYTVIGVIGAVCFNSFELTAVCLLAPIIFGARFIHCLAAMARCSERTVHIQGAMHPYLLK